MVHAGRVYAAHTFLYSYICLKINRCERDKCTQNQKCNECMHPIVIRIVELRAEKKEFTSV